MARESCQNYYNRSTALYTCGLKFSVYLKIGCIGYVPPHWVGYVPPHWVCTSTLGIYLHIGYVPPHWVHMVWNTCQKSNFWNCTHFLKRYTIFTWHTRTDLWDRDSNINRLVRGAGKSSWYRVMRKVLCISVPIIPRSRYQAECCYSVIVLHLWKPCMSSFGRYAVVLVTVSVFIVQ